MSQTSIHYPKIPQNQTAYSKESFSLNPIAKELADTSLSLPIYPGLGKKNIEIICNHIRSFCKNG